MPPKEQSQTPAYVALAGLGVLAVVGLVLMVVFPSEPDRPKPPPGAVRPAGVSQADWDYSVGRFEQQGLTRTEAQNAAAAVATVDQAQRDRKR